MASAQKAKLLHQHSNGIPQIAIKVSETPGSIDRHAPKPGGHNEEVYGRLLGLMREGAGWLMVEGVV
jgi:crotonobetainyl-CoA:carnitine CoA-transferase CaiB-like acyl-CoA transferase